MQVLSTSSYTIDLPLQCTIVSNPSSIWVAAAIIVDRMLAMLRAPIMLSVVLVLDCWAGDMVDYVTDQVKILYPLAPATLCYRSLSVKVPALTILSVRCP